jgi:hypothetical protein
MEFLAGFYIIIGIVIILVKSELIKRYIYSPIQKGGGNLKNTIDRVKVPAYPALNKLELQKVAIRANYNRF